MSQGWFRVESLGPRVQGCDVAGAGSSLCKKGSRWGRAEEDGEEEDDEGEKKEKRG